MLPVLHTFMNNRFEVKSRGAANRPYSVDSIKVISKHGKTLI